MEDIENIKLPHKEFDAKNIFVRDDKKQNYYLIVVKHGKRVDLKTFKNAYLTRHLTFASSEDLNNILNLIPGSVTPLGKLNDKDRKVKVYIDEEFKDNIIGVHPNENSATLFMNCSDLVDLIKEHGNDFYWCYIK